MDKFAVSVIVPIYNVENYLRDCLVSLEKQTLNNIEVILVNDGSTDESEKVAKEFVERNDNFFLVNRDNGGLSAARNTGLDLASGEYIYFLDSDDFISDNALEMLYNKAKLYDLDQIRFSAYIFEDGTNDYQWVGNSQSGYKYTGDYPDIMTGVDFYKYSIKKKNYYPSSCLIFTKKDVINNNNLRFLEGILHEDNLFNFELTIKCAKVSLINEPLYYRRYRKGSIMTSGNMLERIKSLCISSEQADAFIDSNIEIKDIIGRWQITILIYLMLDCWGKMTLEQQNSLECREYFSKVKYLIKKYKIKNFSIYLFYFNKSFYRFFKNVTRR